MQPSNAPFWKEFLPIAPLTERHFLYSGLHLCKVTLRDCDFRNDDHHGYLILISTGPPCQLARKTHASQDIGKIMPHEIILIPPCRELEWKVTGQAEFISLYIDSAYVQQVAGSIGINKPPVKIKSMFQKRDPLLEAIFTAAATKLPGNTHDKDIYIEALTRTACIHLLHTNLEKDLRSTQYQRTLSFAEMERIRAFIMERLEQKIETQELARCVHISEYHFCRVFKRTTSLTPQQFVKQCRLERARFLVEKTPMSMLNIAYQTGFADQSHFSREFRANFGISPRALRDQLICSENMSLAF